MPFIDVTDKIDEELKRLSKKDPGFENHKREFELEYEFKGMLIEARGNMTQAEVSKRSGLSQQAISRIETGSCSTTVRTLLKYLNAIGCRICVEETSDKHTLRTKV